MAVRFYEMAFKIAKEVGNWGIKNQIITALKKLKAMKKWFYHIYDSFV